MKKLLLISLIALCSCNNTFYQVMSVKSDNVKAGDKALLFENEDCAITYNLWGEYGNSGFVFHNKTDRNIYIDLRETFYVLNGQAFDYFKSRTFCSGESVAQGVGVSNTYLLGTSLQASASYLDTTQKGIATQSTGITASKSVSKTLSASKSYSQGLEVKEEPVVCIPPHSFKIIAEYGVVGEIYRQCGHTLYPTMKNVKAIEFSGNNSPIKFKNQITYSILDGETKVIENDFYVNSITNYPKKAILSKEREIDECTGKVKDGLSTVYVFKDHGPNKFYVIYHNVNK